MFNVHLINLCLLFVEILSILCKIQATQDVIMPPFSVQCIPSQPTPINIQQLFPLINDCSP